MLTVMYARNFSYPAMDIKGLTKKTLHLIGRNLAIEIGRLLESV